MSEVIPNVSTMQGPNLPWYIWVILIPLIVVMGLAIMGGVFDLMLPPSATSKKRKNDKA